jgi:Flp pilus assembly pilin Flp
MLEERTMKTVIQFLNDENGSSVVEYGMLTGLITGAIVGPLTEIGQRLSAVFTTIAQALVVH